MGTRLGRGASPLLQRLVSIRDDMNLVPQLRQRERQQALHIGIIFDDEDALAARIPAACITASCIVTV